MTLDTIEENAVEPMHRTTIDEEDIVWVTTNHNGPTRVHTDRDCRSLAGARNINKTCLAELAEHGIETTICSHCAGERAEPEPKDPHETRHALLDLDPADLGLSALGERACDDRRGGDA